MNFDKSMCEFYFVGKGLNKESLIDFDIGDIQRNKAFKSNEELKEAVPVLIELLHHK